MEEKGGQNKEGNVNSEEAPRGAEEERPKLEDNEESLKEDIKCEEMEGREELDQVQNSENKNNDESNNQAASPRQSTSYKWNPGLSRPKKMQTLTPHLPKSLPHLDDPVETLQRDEFIEHMSKYEGPAVAPNEEFEAAWAAMEYELEQIISGGLIPQDSVASSGLNEESFKDFKICAEQLQDNLWDGNLLVTLGNLRGFRRLFSRSVDPVLQHAFRGNPLEVLQNIYYGGNGVLPEDRMMLADPFHYATRDEADKFMFDD